MGRVPGGERVTTISIEGMRVPTVWQPWAWATIYGGKSPENRPKATSYRGWVAIHAGLRWDPIGQADPNVRKAWDEYDAPGGLVKANSLWLPAGVIIGVAELIDCHPSTRDCCQPWGTTALFVEREGRRPSRLHHWVWGQQRLPLIREMRPIEHRGQLGLNTLDRPVAELVAASVATATIKGDK